MSIIKKFNHQPNTFCQGLYLHNNVLYETSGLYFNSFIQAYLSDGLFLKYYFDSNIFIEGLTVLNNILYVVSWHKPKLFKFTLDLKLISETDISNIFAECWGLTNDGENLIVSDGSNNIYYLDVSTLDVSVKIIKKFTIDIQGINALAYIDNKIYANIYEKDIIICIDINKKKIIKKFDFSNYFTGKIDGIPDFSNNPKILNGICSIPILKDHFLITGKYWKKMYLVKLI
jgi:glutamine cyclotransferase